MFVLVLLFIVFFLGCVLVVNRFGIGVDFIYIVK